MQRKLRWRSGDRWRRAREVAGVRRGVVTRVQLLGLGIGAGAIDHRLRTGELIQLHRGVYLFGPVFAPGADEMAAVLACGARTCVSHASAAYLHQLPPYPARPTSVHVSVVERRVVSRPGIVVHEVGALRRDEVEDLDGIPTTTAARTVLDRAPQLTLAALEHLLAQAYGKRLTSRPEILKLLARYSGRPGTPLLRQLLDAPRGPAFTRSPPERRLLRLLRNAGLPEPLVNTRLHGWEVDFFWPDHRLVVEVDALSTHTSPRDFERDRRKDAELVLRGFLVLRMTWRQLRDEPRAVVRRIASALALRRAPRDFSL